MLLRLVFILLFWFSTSSLLLLHSQQQLVEESALVKASREIIAETKFCVLITVDSSGHPQARTMETLPFENITIAWFGTNKNSRKVKEIENDPRVTVYYADNSGNGYVVLKGKATIVDDPREKEKYWQEHWDRFYTDPENTFTLIKVFATSLEVVSYKHGLQGDTITWRAPNLELE